MRAQWGRVLASNHIVSGWQEAGKLGIEKVRELGEGSEREGSHGPCWGIISYQRDSSSIRVSFQGKRAGQTNGP